MRANSERILLTGTEGVIASNNNHIANLNLMGKIHSIETCELTTQSFLHQTDEHQIENLREQLRP